MSISLTCDCGKKLSVKDELLGKQVRCPSCQTSLTVQAGNGTAVKKKGATMNGQKKSNKMLWIAAGAGVLVLGFCCLGIGGVGAWFIFLRGPSAMEKKIVGKWVPDVADTKKAPPKSIDDLKDQMMMAFGGHIEFNSDGTVVDTTPMTPILKGKWKTVSTRSDGLTVEVSMANVAKKLDIKVVDNDHLKITPDGGKEFTFKRAT
jgi:hypothetical protein